MKELIRDYEIPNSGIDDNFKLNSYATFCMDIINLVTKENKGLRLYKVIEWIGEKEFVIDEQSGEKETIAVLSYTARLTDYDIEETPSGQYKKKIKPKKLDKNPVQPPSIQTIDPPSEPKNKKIRYNSKPTKPPKPPKLDIDDGKIIKDSKLVR